MRPTRVVASFRVHGSVVPASKRGILILATSVQDTICIRQLTGCARCLRVSYTIHSVPSPLYAINMASMTRASSLSFTPLISAARLASECIVGLQLLRRVSSSTCFSAYAS